MIWSNAVADASAEDLAMISTAAVWLTLKVALNGAISLQGQGTKFVSHAIAMTV